ncbi:hypothetical protein OG21DRAFT_1427944, partial [Imleria badia]
LQALCRNPESACDMQYLYQRTQQVLNKFEEKNKISIINDIATSWDYLSSSLAGDISENDIVVMASLNGLQIYEDKDSNCWLYIWVVINLAPNKRYCKTHVLPGGFIPGPKKPKIIESFMVIGIHYLSALQTEGTSESPPLLGGISSISSQADENSHCVQGNKDITPHLPVCVNPL